MAYFSVVIVIHSLKKRERLFLQSDAFAFGGHLIVASAYLKNSLISSYRNCGWPTSDINFCVDKLGAVSD